MNCGHPPPLRTGRHLRPLPPPQPSPPLGLHPAPRLQRVHLNPGRRLLLYTDGVTDARDSDNVPFLLDGPEVHAALTAPALTDALRDLTDLLHRHTGDAPVTDDLTLLLAEPDRVPAVPAPRPDPGIRSRVDRQER
ncbi:SpoIIE family protein phosphatase [Streptomyces sp. PmtG]